MSTVQAQIEKKFEIHVKEHPGELLQHINGAWKERRLCDFLIKVGSKEIPVHKIILSEGSDYFKAMFFHKMKEVESGVAVMEGVDPECMLVCIEYIYTGKVTVPESKVQPLLQVASMLQLARLCEMIGSFLKTNLDPESFFMTRKIANTFNLQALKSHCEKYALENFELIAVKEEFKDLETEFVKLLINAKEMISEASKCKALLLWAETDAEDRLAVFEEMFQLLEINEIPATYRKFLLDEKALVFNSAPCLRILCRTAKEFIDAVGRDHKLAGSNNANVIAVFDVNSKSIQASNLKDKSWKKVQSLPDCITNKGFFSATVIDENIFILASDRTNYKLDYTDPAAKWIQLSNRTSTQRVLAISLQGKVYAFQDTDGRSQTIEILDSNQTCWTQTKKPFPCFHASLTATEGHIYSFGGVDEERLKKAAKFDPAIKSWLVLPSMPTARWGAGSTELNGRIYVMGGYGCETTECFNIESETWTTLKSMNYTRVCFTACSLNGRVYAVGGSESRNSIEEYDPDTNTWSTTDMMTGKKIHDQATITLRI